MKFQFQFQVLFYNKRVFCLNLEMKFTKHPRQRKERLGRRQEELRSDPSASIKGQVSRRTPVMSLLGRGQTDPRSLLASWSVEFLLSRNNGGGHPVLASNIHLQPHIRTHIHTHKPKTKTPNGDSTTNETFESGFGAPQSRRTHSKATLLEKEKPLFLKNN